MLDPEPGVGAYLFGPAAVLSAWVLSLSASGLWSRNVGETSCAWRVNYSPDGRAFGIWGAIYLLTFVTAILQMLQVIAVLDWWVNFLWALTWALCSLWVPLFDAEYAGALRSSAVVILCAAGCATAGAARSEMWLAKDWAQRGRQLAAGVPLTLLAGWLLAASAIGTGIAIKASAPDAYSSCVRVPPRRPDESTRAYRERRRVLYREAYAKEYVSPSIVPLFLALAVGGLAVAIRDPVLPLPLCWAVVNLRDFPTLVYMASLVVLLCAATEAGVRVFL